jgi:hypothetical protein
MTSRAMSMGDDFAGLIERPRKIDIATIGRRALKDGRQGVAALETRQARRVHPQFGYEYAPTA